MNTVRHPFLSFLSLLSFLLFPSFLSFLSFLPFLSFLMGNLVCLGFRRQPVEQNMKSVLRVLRPVQIRFGR